MCMLAGFDDYECSETMDLHHLINRAKLKPGSQARMYCEWEHPEIFLVPVCRLHNSMTKVADTKAARKWIVEKLVEDWGEDYVREILNGVPWRVPEAHREYSYEGIMGIDT